MPSRQSSGKGVQRRGGVVLRDGGEDGGDPPVPGETRGLQHSGLVYDGRAGALVEQEMASRMPPSASRASSSEASCVSLKPSWEAM